jgi:hypothetical protein
MQRITALLAAVAIGAIVALAVPAGALAGPALDQYIETLPGAGGDKPSQKGGGGSGSGGGGSGGGGGAGSGGGLTVSGSELEALEASGADGAAAAAALAATAPRNPKGEGDDGKGEGDDGKGEGDDGKGQAGGDEFAGDEFAALTEDGETPISAVFSAVAGGGSGGIVLPIVLVATLLAGLALAARGRRA